jgi:hypothetical protein
VAAKSHSPRRCPECLHFTPRARASPSSSFSFTFVRVLNRLSLLALNSVFLGLCGGRLRRHALRSIMTFGSRSQSLFLGIFAVFRAVSLLPMDPRGLWTSPTPSPPSTEEILSMNPRSLWSSQLVPSRDPRGLWSSQTPLCPILQICRIGSHLSRIGSYAAML